MGGVFCRDSYWGEVRHKKSISCAIIQLQHLFEGRGERGNFAWGWVTNQPPLYTGSLLSEANNNKKKPSDSEDVIIKAACEGPRTFQTSYLILLSDPICSVIYYEQGCRGKERSFWVDPACSSNQQPSTFPPPSFFSVSAQGIIQHVIERDKVREERQENRHPHPKGIWRLIWCCNLKAHVSKRRCNEGAAVCRRSAAKTFGFILARWYDAPALIFAPKENRVGNNVWVQEGDAHQSHTYTGCNGIVNFHCVTVTIVSRCHRGHVTFSKSCGQKAYFFFQCNEGEWREVGIAAVQVVLGSLIQM